MLALVMFIDIQKAKVIHLVENTEEDYPKKCSYCQWAFKIS